MSQPGDMDETISNPNPGDGSQREDLTPGARVGRYVVHDLIGQGGMGLVFTAHDPQLDRWVAIKLLRAAPNRGAAGDSYGQMRLMREAQAMAQLSHPNVLPVYDVGEFGRSVFVAMEFVRGVTLDRWVKQRARAWREIIDVFKQAGQGLIAAHAAGLVHRDFKPANVLMGEDGRPRIGDFGIARSTRSFGSGSGSGSGSGETPASQDPRSLEVPLTQAGAMMGSPGYMAPEQYAGAETSPATDQFAFCVSLYEALYGQRPFRGTSVVELSHVTSMGVVPPAPKGTSVPAWIHRVIEKGLARESTDRHPSMEALLSALGRDPVQALKRRLTALGVALAVGASALATVWTQARSGRACGDAERALQGVWDKEVKEISEKAFLATGRPYAPLSWEHARAQMDQYGRSWSLARTEACEAALGGAVTPDQLEARYSCLDRRLDELKALASAFASADVEVVDQANIAVVRLSPLDDCAHARPLSDRRRLDPEGAQAAAAVAQALAQGRALTAAARYSAAREKLGPAVASAQELKNPALEAEAYLALGDLEMALHRHPQTRDALENAARLAEAAGDDVLAARALSAMVSTVGWRLERPAEGRAVAALASGILERIGGDRRIEARLLEGLGDAQWQDGDRPASLASYRKALDAYAATQGPQSPDVARLHASIGWVLSEVGALKDAREELLKSKAIREKVFGETHPELASMWAALGQLAETRGDLIEAAECYLRAYAISKEVLGPEALPIARAAFNVAYVLALDGHLDRAEPFLQEGTQLLPKHPDAAASYPLQAQRVKARIEAGRGRFAEAARLDRDGVERWEAAMGPDHPETIIGGLDLARDLAALDRRAEALEVFERFLARLQRKGRDRDPDYAAALTDSARVLKAQGHLGEATERLERAVSLLPLERANPRRGADARFALAEALWTPRGDHARAMRLAAEAKEAYAKVSRPDDAARVTAWIAAHR